MHDINSTINVIPFFLMFLLFCVYSLDYSPLQYLSSCNFYKIKSLKISIPSRTSYLYRYFIFHLYIFAFLTAFCVFLFTALLCFEYAYQLYVYKVLPPFRKRHIGGKSFFPQRSWIHAKCSVSCHCQLNSVTY